MLQKTFVVQVKKWLKMSKFFKKSKNKEMFKNKF